MRHKNLMDSKRRQIRRLIQRDIDLALDDGSDRWSTATGRTQCLEELAASATGAGHTIGSLRSVLHTYIRDITKASAVHENTTGGVKVLCESLALNGSKIASATIEAISGYRKEQEMAHLRAWCAREGHMAIQRPQQCSFTIPLEPLRDSEPGEDQEPAGAIASTEADEPSSILQAAGMDLLDPASNAASAPSNNNKKSAFASAEHPHLSPSCRALSSAGSTTVPSVIELDHLSSSRKRARRDFDLADDSASHVSSELSDIDSMFGNDDIDGTTAAGNDRQTVKPRVAVRLNKPATSLRHAAFAVIAGINIGTAREPPSYSLADRDLRGRMNKLYNTVVSLVDSGLPTPVDDPDGNYYSRALAIVGRFLYEEIFMSEQMIAKYGFERFEKLPKNDGTFSESWTNQALRKVIGDRGSLGRQEYLQALADVVMQTVMTEGTEEKVRYGLAPRLVKYTTATSAAGNPDDRDDQIERWVCMLPEPMRDAAIMGCEMSCAPETYTVIRAAAGETFDRSRMGEHDGPGRGAKVLMTVFPGLLFTTLSGKKDVVCPTMVRRTAD